MKIFKFCLVLFLGFGIILAGCGSGAKVVLLDDFENPVSAGPQGSVDFGSGAGSSVDVSASSDEKYSGSQSLKVVLTLYLEAICGLPGALAWTQKIPHG